MVSDGESEVFQVEACASEFDDDVMVSGIEAGRREPDHARQKVSSGGNAGGAPEF